MTVESKDCELLLPPIYVNALQDVQKALSKEKHSFIEVRLFGSCAKGTYAAGSDVDILIITKDKLRDRDRRFYYRELIDNALAPYGIESDVVFYTEDEFKNDKSDFTISIHESFIILKGTERSNTDGL